MTVALHGDSVEVQGLGLERFHRRSRGTCSTAVRERTTSYRPLQLKIYALNLSISLSAGKESNSDAPSNGE